MEKRIPTHRTEHYSRWDAMKGRARERGHGWAEEWDTYDGFCEHPPLQGRSYETGRALVLARGLCRYTYDEGDYTPQNTQWATKGENLRHQLEKHGERTIDDRLALDVSVENGIARGTYNSRRRRGWPIEEACTLPLWTQYIHTGEHNTKHRTSDGSTGRTVAEENDISPDTFGARIRSGWNVDDAATTATSAIVGGGVSPGRVKHRTSDGEVGSVVARRNGISDGVYQSRLSYGWTVDDAATIGVGEKRNSGGAEANTIHYTSSGEAGIEVARRNGIHRSTYTNRIWTGWSVDDAANIPPGGSPDDRELKAEANTKHRTSDGRRGRTVARTNGIPAGTYDRRIREGWSVDDASTVPSGQRPGGRPPSNLTKDGEVGLHVARRNGIPDGTYKCRVSKGWTVDDACTTPPGGKRGSAATPDEGDGTSQ